MIALPSDYYNGRKLETLVENRSIFTLNKAELNVFETHTQAERVLLEFNLPVLASMLKGKKRMHLKGMPSFGFYPGESVILPANELMCIDFPEASPEQPTQCLALAFSEELIGHVVELLNEKGPKSDDTNWSMQDYNFHFTNDEAINQILQRLIFVFTENHPSKDIFSDFLIQELLIRILQIESKSMILDGLRLNTNNNRMSFIIHYIRQNLNEELKIQDLSKKAYMSESSFFRCFKQEMGCSPNEFIIEEKLKIAEDLLKRPEITVKEAYLASGFNSFSYFSRMFRKRKNMSPSEFKLKAMRFL